MLAEDWKEGSEKEPKEKGGFEDASELCEAAGIDPNDSDDEKLNPDSTLNEKSATSTLKGVDERGGSCFGEDLGAFPLWCLGDFPLFDVVDVISKRSESKREVFGCLPEDASVGSSSPADNENTKVSGGVLMSTRSSSVGPKGCPRTESRPTISAKISSKFKAGSGTKFLSTLILNV